ncbi:hairy/enhancer-of-split related with YRPW motif protein 1-like [Branchiostoma lanceolatum]|uniref:hairy/enhancer-of-split related with YRPW motif protein 1-like n=1 Tax=Branchiostoma lanceolatum TaxID=7740 RepID=UPI003453A56F
MSVDVPTTVGASDPALALRLNMQRDNEAYPLPPHKRVKTENMSYELHDSISPVHMAFMTDSRGFRRRNMQGTEEQRDLHRIVEKRRRDRINDCLANIRELLPEELVRQKSCGKAEILELTLMHMKHLQKQVQAYEQGKTPPAATPVIRQGDFLAGYRECLGEAIRYMSQSPVDGVSCEKIESHLRRHCQRLSPYQGFPDTEETPCGLIRDSISPQPEQQMHQDRPMPEEPTPPQHPPHMTDASQQTPSPQTAQSHQAAEEESRRSPMREPSRERSPSRDSQTPHPSLPYTAFPPAPFIPMLALHPSGTHYIPVNFTPPTAVTPQGGQPGQNMVCPFPMMFPAPMYPGMYPPTSMASSGGRRMSGIHVMTPYQPLSPQPSSDESPTTTPREEHSPPNPSCHMRPHSQVPSNDPLNLSTRGVACPEGMSRSPDLPHTVYRHSHNWQDVSPQHGHAMSP